MSPIGPRHAAVVKRLHALLNHLVIDDAIVSVQNPMQLTDYSEPLADLAILRPRDDFYVTAHPVPADIFLLIEVAETSLAYDREEKIPRYAQEQIPEVWLVDVLGETVTQYTRPVQGHYEQEQMFGRGQNIVSPILGSLQVAIDRIFGANL